MKWFCWWFRNPAPVDRWFISLFTGFYTSKRWLFGISSHQQFHYHFWSRKGRPFLVHLRKRNTTRCRWKGHHPIRLLSFKWCLELISNESQITIFGGFLKWWYPTTMGLPTKHDHFGVFWGYHHLRKHPFDVTSAWRFFFKKKQYMLLIQPPKIIISLSKNGGVGYDNMPGHPLTDSPIPGKNKTCFRGGGSCLTLKGGVVVVFA